MGGSAPRSDDLPAEACKTPARFDIASDDFLVPYAERLSMDLEMRGHEVDFNGLSCSGRCCATGDNTATGRAYDWLLAHTLCDQGTGSGCGDVWSIPIAP